MYCRSPGSRALAKGKQKVKKPTLTQENCYKLDSQRVKRPFEDTNLYQLDAPDPIFGVPEP